MTSEKNLTTLLETLEQTQHHIEDLVGQEVDAVILPSGKTYTLDHAQREERRRTRLLRSIIDAVPYHIALLDADGIILDVNQAWRDYAREGGIPSQYEFVGRNYFKESGSGPQSSQIDKGIKAVISREENRFEFEYPCHPPNEKQWYRMVAVPYQHGAVVIHTDITDSRLAADALRRSEEQYRTLFHSNPQPIWLLESETLRVLDVNRAALDQYGYSRKEFLTLHQHDLEAGEESGYTRHRRKNGEVILVECHSHKVEYFDQVGQLVIALDVTEQIKAQQELERSQRLLSVASQLSRVAAWAVNLPSKKLELSKEYRRLLSLTPDAELTLEEALQYVVEDDRASLRANYDRCSREPGTFQEEFRMNTATGETLWIRSVGESLAEKNGSVTRIHGAIQDITTFRKAVDDLRASEQRFRLLSEATDDVIWDWDIKADTLWWNESLKPLLGYDPQELASGISAWDERIHPEDRDRVQASFQQYLESEGDSRWSEEYRFQTADGAYLDVADRGTLIVNEAGEPVRMIGGMADITGRKKTERRLAAQAALLDQASDAIIVHGLDFVVHYWSQGAKALYGWDPEEAVGKSLLDLAGNPTGTRKLKRNMMRSQEGSDELVVHTRKREDVTVFARWTRLRDAFGQEEAILAIHTDITKRKHLEEQLRRSQRLESIGTLAGGIAHDLNNVLAPIVMAVELLTDGSSPEDSQTLLDTLRTSARRGADLVKQILTFARGKGGERQVCDLAELIADVEQMILETFPRNITLDTEITSKPWLVKADPTQLHQVLLNLCVNARDAMPNGGQLEIGLENVEAGAANRLDVLAKVPHIRLWVKDTGSGIPPEVQEKIFEPFFTTKEPGQGTGLGLSTVFTIMREHSGLVTLRSDVGVGSTFILELPALSQKYRKDASSPKIELPKGRGETILLVDDEPAIRNLARKSLSRFGYEVLLADHGAEGLEMFHKHREQIDVVITDMSMPVMDGPSLIRALRNIDPALPVIGCSGRGSVENEPVLEDLNLDHYVNKPYETHTILQVLREVLDRRGSIDTNKVLVVDHNTSLVKLMARVLRNEGYNVLTATTGEEALNLLEEHAPFFSVFSDWELPDLPGAALKERVRRQWPDTKFVFLSGNGEQGEEEVLSKPFTLAELRAVTEKLR